MRWYKVTKILPSVLATEPSHTVRLSARSRQSFALSPVFSPCFPRSQSASPDVSHPPSWIAENLPQLQAVGWQPCQNLRWS